MPRVACPHVHKLDKTNDVLRPGKMSRHFLDLIFILTATHDTVDFHRIESSGFSSFYAPKHISWAKGGSIAHGLKYICVHRIEAHRHAIESCLFEVPRKSRKQHSIRRQREIDLQRSQHFDQRRQPFSEERLSARESDLLNTCRDETASEASNFLETHDFGSR